MELTKDQKRGLSIKDLVTTGIFAAIIFITIMLGGTPFGINPALTFYLPLGSALLGGPVFLLLLAKVPKRGPVIIVGILTGFLFFITGMHWAMSLGYIVFGVIGDIIAGIKKYKSSIFNILAYMVFCLGASCSYLMYFVDPVAWNRRMLTGGTEQAYLDTMNASAYTFMPVIIIAGTLVIAALSGLAGKKLLKKQFEKAGITA